MLGAAAAPCASDGAGATSASTLARRAVTSASASARPLGLPAAIYGVVTSGSSTKLALRRRVVDALRRLPVVLGLRPEDARHEGLRIAVVEREPARLDLHHDPVPRQEHVVRRRQREAVDERLVGRERLGLLEALAVAAAEDVHRDRELVAAHLRLPGHLGRLDVDQLHHPVGVGAARGGDEVRDRLAADLDGRRQRVRHERQRRRGGRMPRAGRSRASAARRLRRRSRPEGPDARM